MGRYTNDNDIHSKQSLEPVFEINQKNLIELDEIKKNLSGKFKKYDSQYGLQLHFFYYLQKLGIENIKVFQGITAMLMSIVVGILFYLLRKNFSTTVALLFSASLVLSPYVVVFARNLYWVEATWFLPMIVSMYYGKIKNWIIWLPSAVESYWVPENKSLVEQIGFELEGLYEFHNSWCVFTYETTSSYQMVKDLNTEMIGSRQLMYIPVFQTNQRISMEVEKITWHYQHHFESVRYTSVDHKSYLDPYSLANVGIKYSYEMQGEPINIGFQVNNLWDANYQMVQNRPMPGRHFNFNINFYL